MSACSSSHDTQDDAHSRQCPAGKRRYLVLLLEEKGKGQFGRPSNRLRQPQLSLARREIYAIPRIVPDKLQDRQWLGLERLFRLRARPLPTVLHLLGRDPQNRPRPRSHFHPAPDIFRGRLS